MKENDDIIINVIKNNHNQSKTIRSVQDKAEVELC